MRDWSTAKAWLYRELTGGTRDGFRSVGAGLLLRTFQNLRGIDIGFRSDHLLTMRTVPARTMTHKDRMNYYDRVIAGVQALPGVTGAAFVSDLPFQQGGNSQAFQIEGRSAEKNGPVRLRCIAWEPTII